MTFNCLVLISCLFVGVFAQVATRRSLAKLWDEYPSGLLIDKWMDYAPVYQSLLQTYKIGGEIRLLEIGVQSGGSMVAWSQWFDDATNFTYVGIDINPFCKQLDVSDRDSIHIEIGSQEDDAFLLDVCNKYGPFDIIIDDGGHTTKQMIGSLRTLFSSCVVRGGYYIIEDTMCGTWSNREEDTLFEGKTFSQHIGHIFESMHSHWATMYPQHHSNVYDPLFSTFIARIQLHDSMAIFEKSNLLPASAIGLPSQPQLVNGAISHSEFTATTTPVYTRFQRGNIRVAYHDTVSIPVGFEDGKQSTLNIYIGTKSDNLDVDRIQNDCRSFCIRNLPVSASHDVIEDCNQQVYRAATRKAFFG